jgi:hypothetical protein
MIRSCSSDLSLSGPGYQSELSVSEHYWDTRRDSVQERKQESRRQLSDRASSVSIAGGIPPKYNKFPFRDTRQELENAINGEEIKIAGTGTISKECRCGGINQ